MLQLFIFDYITSIKITQGLKMHSLAASSSNTLAAQDNPEWTTNKLNQLDFDAQLSKLQKKQQTILNNFTFWNGLADGRLQTMTGILNLFILMIIESLGGKLYNLGDANGVVALGWICIGQTCFFYLLALIVKFCYLPRLQEQMSKNKTSGFIILASIHKRKRPITALKLEEAQLLLQTLQKRQEQVQTLISKKDADSYINGIQELLHSKPHREYKFNQEIQAIKERENSAKYWQAFWQTYVVNKTYSIPGTYLLVFIIILASVTKISGQNIIAQGWVSSMMWLGAILLYIFIKLVLWDSLNEKVQNAKSEPFVLYNSVYYNFREMKSLSLKQLEQLQLILRKRQDQFERCFPSVKSKEVLQNIQILISQKLPKRQSEAQEQGLKEVLRKQKAIQAKQATWVNFFMTKTVLTIISILKYLIVIALCWVKKYPSDANGIHNAQITVGSLGIATLILGQVYYWYLRCSKLPGLAKQVKQASSKAFQTYRLLYFGNKQIKDLNIVQLQEIDQAIDNRRSEFANCFPNANVQAISVQIKQRIRQRVQAHNSTLPALLKKELEAKQRFTFWTFYADGPLLQSMYSIFVLLVLLVVSIIAGNAGAASVLGWVGVAVVSTLVVMVLYFKCAFLESLAADAAALKVPGISEYHLVFTKTKELKNVELSELAKIQKIIRTNPDDFLRCFPTANLESVLNQVKDILQAAPKPLQSQQIQPEILVELQIQNLELKRLKNLLAAWSSVIKERLYVLYPIIIVVWILWVQSIAVDLYGTTVTGFLSVAFFGIVLFFIIFFNCYYRQHLEEEIEKTQQKIKQLQFEKYQRIPL